MFVSKSAFSFNSVYVKCTEYVSYEISLVIYNFEAHSFVHWQLRNDYTGHNQHV